VLRDPTVSDVPWDTLRLGVVGGSVDLHLGTVIETVGRPDFVEVVTRNKILRLVAANLTALAAANEAQTDMADVVRIIIEKSQQGPGATGIARARRAISAWERRSAVKAVGIKGLAARCWYPDPALRDMSDLDLWVPTGSDAADLADALTQSGWTIGDGSPLVDDISFLSSGVIAMNPSDPADAMIDLHYGRLTAGPATSIPITGRPVAGPAGWHRTSDDDTLASVLIGVIARGWITGKDINDVYLAIHAQGADCRSLSVRLLQPGLVDSAEAVMTAVNSLYGHGPALSTSSERPLVFPVGAPRDV
jgi:hypothetical protein